MGNAPVKEVVRQRYECATTVHGSQKDQEGLAVNVMETYHLNGEKEECDG
jgi:hypothetical protein